MGRSQQLSVMGTLSEPRPVQSGVPQGSVLGPLLFIMHVGDIDKNLEHSEVTSFADDTRIRRKVTEVGDAQNLEMDLNKILTWADENNISLNGDKFELLRHGDYEEAISEFNYSAKNQIIEETNHVKDLGVYMSKDASFTHHFSKITDAARKMTGWVLRAFRTRSKKCMMTLWKMMVLPRLEYCCQLWSPDKIQDITSLEDPQRTFTSKIQGF